MCDETDDVGVAGGEGELHAAPALLAPHRAVLLPALQQQRHQLRVPGHDGCPQQGELLAAHLNYLENKTLKIFGGKIIKLLNIFRSDRISRLHIVNNGWVCNQFVNSILKYLNT